MNWGTRVVIAFASFALLVIAMVVISMRQDINLVAKDYYVQEIAYQDQIDKMKNNQALGDAKASVIFDRKKDRVVVNIPSADDISGEILFFRPSDASLDKKYSLQLDTLYNQYFSGTHFKKGIWKVKLNWQQKGKLFYTEKLVVL